MRRAIRINIDEYNSVQLDNRHVVVKSPHDLQKILVEKCGFFKTPFPINSYKNGLMEEVSKGHWRFPHKMWTEKELKRIVDSFHARIRNINEKAKNPSEKKIINDLVKSGKYIIFEIKDNGDWHRL